MVAYATTFWNGSVEHLTEAFASYVGCEAAGNSTATCERTELNKIVPIQAMFDTSYVLFVLLTVVNLLYAMNINDMKALKQRIMCMRYCPCWCNENGKKRSLATGSIPLSSI